MKAIALLALVFFAGALARMEIAVQDEAAFVTDDADLREKSMSQAAALGATYVRQMIWMHMLHPCRGAEALHELNKYTQLVDTAHRLGMQVQLVFSGVAADWGVPRGCAGMNTPTGSNPSLKEYKKFVLKWAEYFGKKGVKRFSLWNEPNHPAFLCAGATQVSTNGDVDSTKCLAPKAKNAALYARIYRIGYAAIRSLQKRHKISKNTKIFIGEFAGNGIDFLEAAAKKGKFIADGFSYHPYQYCTPPNSRKANFVPGSTCQKVMKGISYASTVQAQLGKWSKSRLLRTPKGQRVPLYLTEFGYFRTGINAIPEDVRASWYPMAMNVAIKAGAKGMVLYQFFPSPPGRWDTSLLNGDLTATPAYNALYAWAKSKGYKVKSHL